MKPNNAPLDRAELVTRLLSDLEHQDAEPLVAAFAKALLRRVDDAYLFRHRLVTLAAQLRDSYRWLSPALSSADIAVRVFTPSVADNGYELDGLVIETVMPDQSFIYDTMKLTLEQLGARVLNEMRVVLPVAFAGHGAERRPISIGESSPGAEGFGYTRWFVSEEGLDPKLVEREVTERLTLARAMVADFNRMQREIRAVVNEYDYFAKLPHAPTAECLEVRDFLEWLLDHNFVLMGTSVIARNAPDAPAGLAKVPERTLGLARFPQALPVEADELAFLDAKELEAPLARVHKSSVDSLLHRRGKVDAILVKLFDPDGKPSGGLLLHGMFTFKAIGQPGGQIPMLRTKLATILKAEGTHEGDYDHKSLVSAFNALPVEYLFEADVATATGLLTMTRRAHDHHEFKSHITISRDERSAYVFVVLPKENYSDDLRSQLQSMVQAELGANYADHRLHLGKYGSVALHFYLTSDRPLLAGENRFEQIERRLAELGTPWTLRLRRSLEALSGEVAGAERYLRYAGALPESYTEQTPIDVAVTDIEELDKVIESGQLGFAILPSNGSTVDAILRIYSPRDLLLTEILPVVDNFGVVVAEQNAWDVQPEHSDKRLQINTLRIRRGEHDLLEQRQNLIEALSAVFSRKMRSDRINRLLLPARITWKDVEVFRSYFYYSRQLGSTVTPEIIQKVLTHHAPYVSQLTELFRARFDPSAASDERSRQLAEERLIGRLMSYLDGIASFDEDKILRTFLALVKATVRTNVYKPRDPSEPVYYSSFKLDSSKVPDMPHPRPYFEIWVHATEVEGIHLRGGKVARGGLRWSDRLDDFRSEILGLMATQQLKNAVIVPVGAKGGFVLKTPPEDWREARAQADRFYEVFIRGLLDLTDNIVDGALIPPAGVVCHDAPDPYLVVAADKGTAHLSDTANRLAKHYGFWLGDAFASGGSIGYDHKIKGITAKGAWVCVRRSFYERGLDPNVDPITVVGIGDMSGDVFGNGLLLSRTVRLVGAFDHRHIFLDPNPQDAEAAWNERKRLFDKKGSRWTDYDPDLISKGGGVFERGAKSIALWPEVQKLLGTELAECSGEELVRLLLKADVQLLWNGGIGTYVKASFETHQDARDPANDRVRVNADELRCDVIGEGGNLGMTQRARNQFAELGGSVNMDAIDNSGGVDLSDHEVNIKTLLRHALESGELTPEQRNALIVEVGDEVCELVLADNEGQALAVSLDSARSRRDLWSFWHTINWLKDRIGFSRYGEHLPHTLDIIAKRREHGRAMLRPELSKLLLYSKMAMFNSLVKDPPGGKAERLPFLERYFPKKIVSQLGHLLERHFLFDEIAGTVMTNHIIDRAGVTLLPTLGFATEREPAEIAAAYLLAELALDANALREAIDQIQPMSAENRYPLLMRVEDALVATARAILWVSGSRGEKVTLSSASAMAPALEAAKILREGGDGLLPERARRFAREDARQMEAHETPSELAQRLSRLTSATHALWVAELAAESGRPVADAAAAYFAGGSALNLFELVSTIERQEWPDRWDMAASGPLMRQLYLAMVKVGALTLARGEEVLKHPSLTGFAAQVDETLKQRVPVSALIVLTDRLRQRLAAV
jgi:glutamate dehydrogenase